MMSAIFCISADSFYAKNNDDPLSWTGFLDKKLFRLLSHCNGGINVVGRKTYKLMPNLPSRKVLPISRNKDLGKSLEEYMQEYNDLNLLGGLDLLRKSILENRLDILFLSIIENVNLKTGLYFDLFDDNVINKHSLSDTVQLENLRIEIYKFPHT